LTSAAVETSTGLRAAADKEIIAKNAL
jgi:hypothetical protein